MSLRKQSYLDESVTSSNANIQLAKLSGITKVVRTVTDTDVLLADYESGAIVILAITGGTDVNLYLPAPTKSVEGVYYTIINKASPTGSGDCVISTITGTDNIVSRQSIPAQLAQASVYVITFAGAFVASNTIDLDINDQPITRATFADDSNTTIRNLATNIAAHADVSTAVANTVNRTITVTSALKGVPLTISIPTIASGSSQTTATVAIDTSPFAINTNQLNTQADNVKVEAASQGAEWLEFVCDGELWYCNATAGASGALSLNGK